MTLYSFLSQSRNPNFNKIISTLTRYAASFCFTARYTPLLLVLLKSSLAAASSRLCRTPHVSSCVFIVLSHLGHVVLQLFHLLVKKCPVDCGCVRYQSMVSWVTGSFAPTWGGPVHSHMNSLSFVFLLCLDSKRQQAQKTWMSPEKGFRGGTGAKVQVGEIHAYFKHLVNYCYFKANKVFEMV